MKWMQMLLVGAAVLIGIKIFMKTLKLFSILAIVAAALGAFWLWQHGMLPLPGK